MELNGVANITMIADRLKYSLEQRNLLIEEDVYAFDQIKQQLELLNRYMIAVSDEIHANEELLSYRGMEIKIPAWHEIRENPSKYPTLREKVATFQKEIKGKNT